MKRKIENWTSVLLSLQKSSFFFLFFCFLSESVFAPPEKRKNTTYRLNVVLHIFLLQETKKNNNRCYYGFDSERVLFAGDTLSCEYMYILSFNCSVWKPLCRVYGKQRGFQSPENFSVCQSRKYLQSGGARTCKGMQNS